MQRIFASTFVVAALLFQLCPTVVSLQRGNFPAASDYALEYNNSDGQPAFTPINSKGPTTLFFFDFKRRQDWHDPSTQADASAIKLVCSREEDTLKIVASVYFGPFDRNEFTHSLEGLPNKPAGVYIARLNEKFVIQELSQHGIEPLEVGVVTAKSDLANTPEIINRTTSIEVVGIEEARGTYLLSLRNNSSKDVLGLTIRVPTKGGASSQLAQSFPDKPLIPSRQIYETQVHISRGGRQTPQGFVPDEPEQPRIVIDGILFVDSTYEGEVEAAVAATAHRSGRRLQVKRLLALLDQAAENRSEDMGSVIERLKKRVMALSEVPEPWVARGVAENFPGLEVQVMSEAPTWIESGLKSAKQSILFDIRDFQRDHVEKRKSLQMWLNRMRIEHEDLMTRL